MSLRRLEALVVLALALSANLAAAQTEPPAAAPPPPPPTPEPAPAPRPAPGPPVYVAPPGYYAPPPPPPLPPPGAGKRGVHEHDGFFLRMGLGLSGMVTKTDNTLGQAAPGGDLTGGGGAIELLMGGTPARGFVLGGGLVGHTWDKPKYDVGGTSTELRDSKLGLTFLALFGQLYFDPEGGWYVQALIAAAEESYSYQVAGETRETELGGVGVAVGGGVDFWVGEQWSLGPALRLSYASLEHDAEGVVTRHRTTALTLSFTATLH